MEEVIATLAAVLLLLLLLAGAAFMYARPDVLVNWERRLYPHIPWLGSPWHRRYIRAQGAAIIVIFAFTLTAALLGELAVPPTAQVLAAVLVATTLGALLFLGSNRE